MAQVRKIKSTLEPDLERQATNAFSEGVSLEPKKEFVPLYARPINEKNTMKVVNRKEQRENFKAKLLASKRKLQGKDEMLDN